MQIELRDVHKWFGANHVLRGIRLEVPAGRRIGLIGPNGSGKSTLTRVIMGMLSCEGSVRLDGADPAEQGQGQRDKPEDRQRAAPFHAERARGDHAADHGQCLPDK